MTNKKENIIEEIKKRLAPFIDHAKLDNHYNLLLTEPEGREVELLSKRLLKIITDKYHLVEKDAVEIVGDESEEGDLCQDVNGRICIYEYEKWINPHDNCALELPANILQRNGKPAIHESNVIK